MDLFKQQLRKKSDVFYIFAIDKSCVVQLKNKLQPFATLLKIAL